MMIVGGVITVRYVTVAIHALEGVYRWLHVVTWWTVIGPLTYKLHAVTWQTIIGPITVG